MGVDVGSSTASQSTGLSQDRGEESFLAGVAAGRRGRLSAKGFLDLSDFHIDAVNFDIENLVVGSLEAGLLGSKAVGPGSCVVEIVVCAQGVDN